MMCDNFLRTFQAVIPSILKTTLRGNYSCVSISQIRKLRSAATEQLVTGRELAECGSEWWPPHAVLWLPYDPQLTKLVQTALCLGSRPGAKPWAHPSEASPTGTSLCFCDEAFL